LHYSRTDEKKTTLSVYKRQKEDACGVSTSEWMCLVEYELIGFNMTRYGLIGNYKSTITTKYNQSLQ